ncbi:MAG: aldehyde ferredoxin oxidoreductase N-terminal domain-containing protein [Chloroflexota bacterium]|nr:aldehyde ferredoxin oxidoreductase N-terminal domain-containing protein [Chloroflexota bacterium]
MQGVFGWTGKILNVDLSSGEVSYIDTTDYVPAFIGGLGVAARIAWERGPLDPDPFAPENPLLIMTGPLTGTLASGAGRVEVAGVAPQQHPPVFSRSGMGGHWGAELKYAGYDGIVVEGKADAPVYLWIDDDEVQIRDAGDIWGTGTFHTTQALRGVHGKKVRVIACGQAGENLCRVAVIQTETGNAAGQGGFGAVMGSKNLKAVAVRGTGGVRVADPQRFMNLCLQASREGQRPYSLGIDATPGEHYRVHKCGFCMTPCVHRIYMDVPSRTGVGTHTVARQCWGYMGSPEVDAEARSITSDYGLNGWEISYGIIPWLQMCKQHGLIEQIDGLEIPAPSNPVLYLRDAAPCSAEFLATLVRKMARREGEVGDALADGACYAADRLFDGRGRRLLDHIYPRHGGQTEHWGGHWGPGGVVYWPWWLPAILQWCVDTRDPANDSTHQWTEHVQHYLSQSGPDRGPFSLEKVRNVCAKVYGNPDVGDPSLMYDPPEAKAIPAIWHSDRGMIVDSLVLCDYENTRVFSALSEDGAADTALMAKLFSACTGHGISEEELDRAGERIWNQLRAIDVRDHGRDRDIDESTLDGFMYPGKDDGVMLDRQKFLKLMDIYYTLRGWDVDNGWPTRDKLQELNLTDVAEGLDAVGRLG